MEVTLADGDGDGGGLFLVFVGVGVAVTVGNVGDGVVGVGVGDFDDGDGEAVCTAPPKVGVGNCSFGWPASAPSMNAFQTRAGSDPPVTSESPATPCRGVMGSLNKATAAAS